MAKALNFVLATTLSLTFAATALAKSINIYQKPDAKAKVSFSIAANQQLIPIFHSQDKQWIKVANPQDGQVGWAKATDLNIPLVLTKVNGSSVEQQVIMGKNGTGPHQYSYIQYSGPKKLTKKQMHRMLIRMRRHNRQMRRAMHRMQRHMRIMMRHMFRDFSTMDHWDNRPVLEPGPVLPPTTKTPKSEHSS